MKVMIAGGTGFIGKYLEKRFIEMNHQPFILTRKPSAENHIEWNGIQKDQWMQELEDCALLINLAGKSINCRHHARNVDLLTSSRVNTTKRLNSAIERVKPKNLLLFVNASTASIYRNEYEGANTESKGTKGSGAMYEITKHWEDAFFDTKDQTRRVAMRIALALGQDGGAYPLLRWLCYALLGGRQGNGNQMVSWIHVEDIFQSILYMAENQTLSGPVNMVTPDARSNLGFMLALRKSLGVPVGMPQPEWLIRWGTKIIGTEDKLLLDSRWLYPEKLIICWILLCFSEP